MIVDILLTTVIVIALYFIIRTVHGLLKGLIKDIQELIKRK